MELLARSTDYAIRALMYMATDRSRLVSTTDLHQDLKLPRPFMRKTLQVLQQAGYLVSVKGVGGGFKLVKAPHKVRLIDLMETFQGDLSFGNCLFKKRLCRCVKTCPLRREVKRMESMVIERLRKVTLADLIKDAEAVGHCL